MLKLRQTGMLKRIMDKTWQQHTSEIVKEHPPVVPLAMVANIHILFLFGVLLSLVILFMECIIWRGGWYKQKRAW
jgi:capsular polysaccharide biosynthesis protein